MAKRYVIVGGGVAASSAIDGIKEVDPSGEIVLLTAEKELPYHRPPLSKGYLAGRDGLDAVRIHDPAWYRGNGIRVHIGQVAKSVHLKKRSLTLESGERESYDRLLLATGSRARRVNAPGWDLAGVVPLRSLPDGNHLRALLKPGTRVVCVGGGFIGVEVAATARQLGLEPMIVEAGPTLLRSFADPDLGAFFQNLLVSRGVAVRTNTRVARFRGQGEKLNAVVAENGDQIPADVAVLGAGAEPNTEWLASSGFGIDRGGVVVNVRLETPGTNVWAAGDIARFPDPVTHQPRRLEHWDNAVAQGKQAGRNMAGADENYAHQSMFFSDIFDVTVNVLGDTEKADRIERNGNADVKEPRFTVHYVRAHKLVGAVMVHLASEDRSAEFESLQQHLLAGTIPGS